MKELFKKVEFENNKQTTKKRAKLPSRQRDKGHSKLLSHNNKRCVTMFIKECCHFSFQIAFDHSLIYFFKGV